MVIDEAAAASHAAYRKVTLTSQIAFIFVQADLHLVLKVNQIIKLLEKLTNLFTEFNLILDLLIK